MRSGIDSKLPQCRAVAADVDVDEITEADARWLRARDRLVANAGILFTGAGLEILVAPPPNLRQGASEALNPAADFSFTMSCPLGRSPVERSSAPAEGLVSSR